MGAYSNLILFSLPRSTDLRLRAHAGELEISCGDRSGDTSNGDGTAWAQSIAGEADACAAAHETCALESVLSIGVG